MRKYTERHNQLMTECNERLEHLKDIVNERVLEPDAPIPLDFIIESRFYELKKSAIKVEAEINFLKENDDDQAVKSTESQLNNLSKRLTMIHGAMNETKNINQLLFSFNRHGREFEVTT